LELSLATLRIHHTITYRYRQPVRLGPHRLMRRPHESRDRRLIVSNVTVTPGAIVTWAHDVFGNAVATATIYTMTDNLVIDSVAELALSLTASASGLVRTKTTSLLTIEETDKALAKSANYRAPGR
jgi:hypothetical protein